LDRLAWLNPKYTEPAAIAGIIAIKPAAHRAVAAERAF
jgi:hypothetical protein